MAGRPSIARGAGGFTMVELLVVMAVLGTLTTLTVTRVASTLRRSAQQSACRADRSAIQFAEEANLGRTGGYDSQEHLVTGGLLGSVSPLHKVTVTTDGTSYAVTPADGRCTAHSAEVAAGPVGSTDVGSF